MILKLNDLEELYPSLTQQELDALELTVRELTNNKFHHRHVRNSNLSLMDNRIISSDELVGYQEGDTIELIGTLYNDGLHLVSSVSEFYLELEQPLIDENAPKGIVAKVDYPADLAFHLMAIVQYRAKMAGKVGIKSESIARKSTTYFDNTASESIEGLPAAMWAFIKKYRKIKW